MIVSCQNTGNTSDIFKTSNLANFDARVLMMASASGIVQYSFPCGLRGFHAYKEIWKPKVGDVLSCIHERNNQHDRYAIAATNLLPGRLSNVTLGHLPREISRFTRFLISRGADVSVTVKDAHFRRSPLIHGGLEIPVEATVRMEALRPKFTGTQVNTTAICNRICTVPCKQAVQVQNSSVQKFVRTHVNVA